MPRKTKEEEIEDMELGKKEEDPYTEAGREIELDEDSLTDEDEGFMEGYEYGGTEVRCASCGKILEDKFIEKEIDGRIFHFCSSKCVHDFEKQRK